MPIYKTKSFHFKCRGILTCLFTTAFLFCFALFALYKYALIDANSVILKNSNIFGIGNPYEFDDYGIDVSALRYNTPKSTDGKPVISDVDKWDLKVHEDGGARMGYITDDCDNPTQVFGVAYLTQSDKGALKVVVMVNYTAEKNIEVGTGEAVILAKFGKVLVTNETLELCSVDEQMLACPIKKGINSFRRDIILPRFAPKGRYHGTIVLRYIDTKEVQLCARGRMIL